MDTSKLTLNNVANLPIGAMGWAADNSIWLRFHSSENGKDITMIFEPEADITVKELMHLNMLTTLLVAQGVAMREQPLAYIRKYHLERHFKFVV